MNPGRAGSQGTPGPHRPVTLLPGCPPLRGIHCPSAFPAAHGAPSPKDVAPGNILSTPDVPWALFWGVNQGGE